MNYYKLKLGEYNYDSKILVDGKWLNDWQSVESFYGNISRQEYTKNYKANRMKLEKSLIRSQNNHFCENNIEKIKISRPLNKKGAWLGSAGNELFYGIFIDNRVWDNVLSKYLDLLMAVPIIHDNTTVGQCIAPYYGFKESDYLDYSKSQFKDWPFQKVYYSKKLINMPDIFNFRVNNDDFGLMSSLGAIVFSEEVKQKLDKIGIKSERLTMNDD